MPEPRPISVGPRLKECGCGWYRVCATDRFERERKYVHLIYGEVTHERAAELDAQNHRCGPHLDAVKRLIENGVKRRG